MEAAPVPAQPARPSQHMVLCHPHAQLGDLVGPWVVVGRSGAKDSFPSAMFGQEHIASCLGAKRCCSHP